MRTILRARADAWLMFVTTLLVGMSILMVFSTTGLNGDSMMLKKHLFQVLCGLVALACMSRVPLSILHRISGPFLILSLISLVLVLIPGIGHVAGGARRWLILGPVRVQPGEFAKLAVVLYMASYIHRHHGRMLHFLSGAVIPLSVVAAFAAVLLLEPDFGSTVIILLVVFFQLMTASSLWHLLALGASAVMAMGALIVYSPYRFKRFESFLDPFQDASASGYQLVQSLIAVGSGGLTGEGLGAGKQKLFYLPAAHTDFIFAVIAEELGLVGVLAVIILFLAIAGIGISLARRHAANPFSCALAIGATGIIVVPALLNMAVVLGLLPTKGLVLPLIAYGGSAMIVNLAAVGILLSLSRSP